MGSSIILLPVAPFSICPTSLPNPGDGKTHYIKQQLVVSPASVTVSVNEAFTPLNAISKLRKLPVKQKNCAIFFNFTMLPPGVRKDGLQTYKFSCYDVEIAVVIFKAHVFNFRLQAHTKISMSQTCLYNLLVTTVWHSTHFVTDTVK